MKVLLIFFLTTAMHAEVFSLAIKIPFSNMCLKRPFFFHFVYRCSVQTPFPPLLAVEVWGRVIWFILILKVSEALILIAEENDSFSVTF